MNQKIVLTLVAFLTVQSLVTTFGSLAQLNEPNQNDSAGEANVSMDLTSILPIVAMVKGQVKEIVLDLVSQVFQYIRAIVQECKVRLLRRLGKYTLSDVFHLVFDGVIEFVNEETTMSTTTEQLYGEHTKNYDHSSSVERERIRLRK
ncbi:unnamed protein product, partial [Iphiclides podalirius]